MKFSDFIEYVQGEVPGCPNFTIERAVRDAAITLCARTDVYRPEPETLQIIPNLVDYDLDAPRGTEINRVLEIQRNGQPIEKLVSDIEVYRRLGNRSSTGKVLYFSQRDNTGIIMGPVPDEAETLTIFLSLKPDASATSIPDTLGKEYRNQIVMGAKSSLMLMSGKAWSNPALGKDYEAKFTKAVGGVVRQVKFGFSGAPARVRPRSFI